MYCRWPGAKLRVLDTRWPASFRRRSLVLSVTLSIRHDDGLVNAPDGMWSHHNTYNTRVILNMCLHQLSGLAVRVSALSLVSRGSIPGQVIPKTRKMRAQRLEKWHSASRVGLAVGVRTLASNVRRFTSHCMNE